MSVSLLSSTAHVETPVIHVKIGNNDFGIYQKDKKGLDKYPNYIQDLNIVKINGQVNSYTLKISYNITEYNDPNFFAKVFGSVSKSRQITFSYGDISLPNFYYREEVALITKIKTSINIKSASLEYIVYAISQSKLTTAGVYTFPAIYEKPSIVLMNLLKNPLYGLFNVFPGMRDLSLVSEQNLIPSNDMMKQLSAQTCCILDYMKYLVNMMTPVTGNSILKPSVYVLQFVDDTSGVFNGTYFKVIEVDTAIEHSEAYILDVGYPGNNAVLDIQEENDEEYSIYYDYQNELNPVGNVLRVGYTGEDEYVYAPILSSGNPRYRTKEEEKSYWSKITEFPVKCSITLKGLLRPAILMEYVRLNIYFYGKKFMLSGLYIITSQTDSVNYEGYRTTLNMIRVAKDEDIY